MYVYSCTDIWLLSHTHVQLHIYLVTLCTLHKFLLYQREIFEHAFSGDCKCTHHRLCVCLWMCVSVNVSVCTYLPVFIWALPAATAPNSLELSLSSCAVRPLSRGKTRRRRRRPTWRWPRNHDRDLCVCVCVCRYLQLPVGVCCCCTLKSTWAVASNTPISISIISYPMKFGIQMRVYSTLAYL